MLYQSERLIDTNVNRVPANGRVHDKQRLHVGTSEIRKHQEEENGKTDDVKRSPVIRGPDEVEAEDLCQSSRKINALCAKNLTEV